VVNRRYIAQRAVFGAVSFYAVVSLVFFFIALAPDPNAGLLAYRGASEEEIQAMLAAKGYNEPLLDRYLGYIWDITTLDWGRTTGRFGRNGPKVLDVLAKHLPYTLVYTIPAVIVGFAGGIGLGVYAAVNKGGRLDNVVQSIGYFGFGIPNFFAAELAVFVLQDHFELLQFTIGRQNPRFYIPGETVDIWQLEHLGVFAVVSAILAISLIAGQLRYARSECLEYVSSDFVKLARAKGASEYRVMAHVARNAALPLMAMFLADLVTVLVVHVFVLEFVFNVPGIGQMGIVAVKQRDMPFVMGITICVAGFGVFANFLQDIGLGAVDPRTDAD
jgi:peptide/nickel transport system permease protein